MTWYPQSLNAHDTHRGHLRRGRVLATCGVEFSPLRAWRKHGSALFGEPSEPGRICPECYRPSLSGDSPAEPFPAFRAEAARGWIGQNRD